MISEITNKFIQSIIILGIRGLAESFSVKDREIKECK